MDAPKSPDETFDKFAPRYSHHRMMQEIARAKGEAVQVADALRKLLNEVSGLSGFGPEVKALIGVTNWNVLQLRAQEARVVLTQAPH